jgi:hypothetical protein
VELERKGLFVLAPPPDFEGFGGQIDGQIPPWDDEGEGGRARPEPSGPAAGPSGPEAGLSPTGVPEAGLSRPGAGLRLRCVPSGRAVRRRPLGPLGLGPLGHGGLEAGPPRSGGEDRAAGRVASDGRVLEEGEVEVVLEMYEE